MVVEGCRGLYKVSGVVQVLRGFQRFSVVVELKFQGLYRF